MSVDISFLGKIKNSYLRILAIVGVGICVVISALVIITFEMIRDFFVSTFKYLTEYFPKCKEVLGAWYEEISKYWPDFN